MPWPSMTKNTPNPLLAEAAGHHQSGRLDMAEGIYRRILAEDPRNSEAMQLLGTLLCQRGDMRDGIELIRRSIAIQPTAHAFINLSEFCRRLGNQQKAMESILDAIRLKPSAIAYDKLAVLLMDLGFGDAAEDAMRAASRFDVNHTERLRMLETFLHEKPPASPRDQIEGINDLGMLLTLSAALTHVHRYSIAIEAAQRAIALRPNLVDAHVNLGSILGLNGNYNESITACEKAISLDSQNPGAHLNLAMAHLVQGDLARGLPLYEWRSRTRTHRRRNFTQPQWDGRPLHGKSILLWHEQGLGDTMHFVRYVPQVIASGGKVILQVQAELLRLIQNCFPAARCISSDGDPGSFDLQSSLLSLPMAFGTTLETIPASVPYLRPPAELIDKWQQKLQPFTGRPRVGLTWAGRLENNFNSMRSIKLKQLAPLTNSGATFFSLQKSKPDSEFAEPPTGMRTVDWTSELNDLCDTAALIANLDLVISVDTAVAHLAGAMAKPVWVFVTKVPDWRWLLDRRDSPWYPTLRLFRQPKAGDWETPINLAADELRNYSKMS